jgi:hypothetical protein
MLRTFTRFLCRGLAAVAAVACTVSTAHAQAGTPPGDSGFPILPTILAVLATGLLLLVVCLPSGKEA